MRGIAHVKRAPESRRADGVLPHPFQSQSEPILSRAALAFDLRLRGCRWAGINKNAYLEIMALCVVLAGCALARQRRREELLAATTAQVKAAVETYQPNLSEEPKDRSRQSSVYRSGDSSFRPLVPYPDLYDQETTNRNMLAERWQTGKITQLEYEAQFSEMHSQIVAEEQRRNLANRSVNAQETAATAALLSGGPTICNRVGNTTICN